MNSRLQRLRKLLKEKNLDAVFISSLPNITYLTNFSDFTTTDRDGYLLLTKTHQYIFTHGIYKEAVQQQVPDFALIEIQRENPISVAVKNIVTKEKIKRMGVESFDLKVNEYEKLLQEVNKKILTPTTFIETLRIHKTTEEIQALQRACQLGDKALHFISNKLTSGMTEIDVAVELEFFIKRHGADLSFPSIVAFGAHASKPHHVPTTKKLTNNTMVLLDFGVKLNNYCSDMTRTSIFGKANTRQTTIYQTVLAAQQKAKEFIADKIAKQEKISAAEVDAIAREYIVKKGFPSFPHSLGHGIGLEVHESPRLTPISNETLEDGMVFSIEPGIYFPGEIGVRIEDLYTIKQDTLVQLTTAPNKLIQQ